MIVIIKKGIISCPETFIKKKFVRINAFVSRDIATSSSSSKKAIGKGNISQINAIKPLTLNKLF